jgi:alkyl hydroperoxide reductase subunit AhpC|tara:strand:- start:772 stop:1281 length:510 start_codon:yes stop_codon:yes gene_type:complete
MHSVNDEFPPFILNGVDSNQDMVEVNSSDLEGWRVFYFYPKDFTFICPTEISAMDKVVEAGATVIGFSGDNEFCKHAWKEVNGMIRNINHTLAADCGLALSTELGVVDFENGVCLRATFIVDPNNIVQSVSCNALDTGRNADEIVRTLKALQAGGLTGCAWQEGEDFVA